MTVGPEGRRPLSDFIESSSPRALSSGGAMHLALEETNEEFRTDEVAAVDEMLA